MKEGCFIFFEIEGIKYAPHLTAHRRVHEFLQRNFWKDILMFQNRLSKCQQNLIQNLFFLELHSQCFNNKETEKFLNHF